LENLAQIKKVIEEETKIREENERKEEAIKAANS